MSKKKLAIIGIVGVPANYGGFETLVENLLDLLPAHFDVTVFCEADGYSNKISKYKGAELVYLNLKANGIQSIAYDMLSLFTSFRKNDYLLVLGVSGAIALPIIKKSFKGRIITNIDGLEWKRDKWNFFAKKFLKMSEKIAVNYSDTVITDNLHIQKHVNKEYHKESVFIAYGGDHVSAVNKDLYLDKYPFLEHKFLFTVCRIEPENNLIMLIEGFLKAQSKVPYVIIGNWEASKFGQHLIEKYGNESNIYLLNPIYDTLELNALRSNCFYYLHGHSAGGTNPSLVEAMYLGLPIISYDVAYNKASTSEQAIYFRDQVQLSTIISELFNSTENSILIKRDEYAKKMKVLAEKNYTWRYISDQYIQAIKG
ncbi:DUF1972 domain-containing protein [Anditalea andensis]|uniref:Glycosyl transferase n=1 Tax=Anditalea andensis TaxID=1048983 RepID=A0A074L0R7_9BACT|nr:DUF1972 domain-containing protein [Anditalea andensis]KEO73453.1 glycosyl transferase [Anditalea andensis]